MYEVIIKYKNRKTLKTLAVLGEFLGFTVAIPDKKYKGKIYYINGVQIQQGDAKIDIKDVKTIFTAKDIDAKNLRKSAWQRKK